MQRKPWRRETAERLAGRWLPLLAMALLALPAARVRADDILLYPPAGQQPIPQDEAPDQAAPVRPPVTPPGYEPPSASPDAPVPATVPVAGGSLPQGDDLQSVQQVLKQMEQEARQNPGDPSYPQAIDELRRLESQLQAQGGDSGATPPPFPGTAP